MKKLSTEQWIQQAKEIHGEKFDYSLTMYSTAKTKLIVICPTHGEQEMLPQHHLRGYGCGVCGKKQINISNGRQLSQSEFINRGKGISDNLSFEKTIYKSKREIVTITCLLHGDFETKAEMILKGCGCPRCKISKGEIAIENWLISKNIRFEIQKDFEGCVYKKQLKFDFYLPDYNTCIEYDGKQHFKPIEFFGGMETLRQNVIRDAVKESYCRGNNLNILRISYNDNIQEILENFFNN